MDSDLNDIHQLSALDPARERVPTEAEWQRARARLDALIEGAQPAAALSTRRRTLLAAGSLVAAGTAAAVILGASALTSTDSAHAAWLPVPSVASPAQALAQAEDCARSWEPADIPRGGVAAADVLLAERRGTSAMTVMRKGATVIECLDTQSGIPVGWSQVGEADTATPSAKRVTVADLSTTGDGDQQQSNAVGRVGSEITEVEIVRPNGDRLQASVANGWWAAWWPGGDGADPAGVMVVTTTAAGNTSSHSSRTLRVDNGGV